MTLKRFGFVSSLALVAALASPAYAQGDNQQDQTQTTTKGPGEPNAAATTTTQGQATAGNPDNESTTTTDRANQNNEIIVTAEFRKESLQNTPIAITAVNGAMLDQRGQTDIAQVASQAPNVTLTPQSQIGGVGLIAFIRGVGQTDFDYALEPGVGIYVDDVYIPTLSASLLNLMDVDRVEILRGPQGVLGGKNSIGGAIKLFSKKPEGSNTGYLEAGYGSFNELKLRGMADLKITDTISARVSGVSISHDGWVDMIDYGLTHPNSNVPANDARSHYALTNREGSQNMQAGRLALRWQPSSNLDINISADYTNEHDSPVPDVLIAAGGIADKWQDFKPLTTSDPATNANGGPWLPGKNGAAIPVDCHFVPYGQYSCDTGAQLPGGVDPRYMTYANFLDGMAPTSQAPFKPYAALQNSDFVGGGIMGNVQWNLSDQAKFTWISSYRWYQSNFSQDQDATPVPVAQLDNQLNAKAWSQELRMNGELGKGFFEYTLGGFYMKQNNRYSARVDLNYAGIDFVHGPDLTPSTSKALFFNGTIHPTDAWSITGGVRRSWDHKTYTYFRSNPDGTVPFEGALAPPPGLPPICEAFLGLPQVTIPGVPTSIGNSPNCLLTGLYDVQGEFKGSRWDWRAVTDYRFSPQFLAYASISTGYMAGGVNPRPFFGPSAGECDAPGYVAPAPCDQIKPFSPETLTTYEVGFKSDLFDRRLRLNGAAFYNKFNDIILTLSACPSIPCIQPRNIGKAHVKGFELEMEAHPANGFELDGSLSYIDFKYTDTGNSGVPLTAVTPFTPEWTWSVGAQYDYRMTNDSDIGIRLDGNYQSKIYSETFNSSWGEIPGRFIGNGRVYYKSPNDDWELSLEVKNIFNKYYFVTKEDVTTSLGEVLGQPGMPRTWLVSLRRNFNAAPPPPPPPVPVPAPAPEVAAPPPPPPPPVATYKQCLDGSVVKMEEACPPPPAPAVAPQGERG